MRTLGIMVVLALLAGCTSGGDRPASRRPPTPTGAQDSAVAVADGWPTEATRRWSRRLQALQAPVPADDVLVTAVTARGDEADVVALDRDDGTVRWRRPLMVVDSSIGAFLGDLVHVSADGATYVVMQQAPTGRSLRPGAALPYLALDPSTGEVLARTRPVVAQFGAPSCDDGIDACLRISEDDRFAETRWVLDSGELRPEKDPIPAGATTVVEGSDVYFASGTVQGYAVATAVGRVGPEAWRVPHARITGGSGWLLDDDTATLDERAGVAVLQVLRTTPQRALDAYESGRAVSLDLAQRRTVGVDIETGDVLWRHRGADLACLELTRSELPVRCSFTGARVYQQDRDPRLESARGHLEGYDPRTGRTTWRIELDRAATRTLTLDIDRLDAEVDRIEDADDAVVVPTPDGPRLLSLTDGSTRSVSDGEALLCSAPVPYRHRLDTVRAGVVGLVGGIRERQVAEPCDARGRGTGRRPGATALLTSGVDAGDGIRVVVRRGAVEAYDLS